MKPDRITHQSRKAFESTEAYKEARRGVVREIHHKYRPLLDREKNVFRRWLLQFRKRNELKKRIAELNPPEALFQKR